MRRNWQHLLICLLRRFGIGALQTLQLFSLLTSDNVCMGVCGLFFTGVLFKELIARVRCRVIDMNV